MILKVDFLKSINFNVDIKYTLLVLSTIAIPINLSIIGPLRLLDIFLLILIGICFSDLKLKITTFQIYFGLLVLGVISTILSVYGQGITGIQTIFFAYKFTMPILILKTLEKIDLSESQVKNLLNWQLLVYIFLILWVFLYLYLRSIGVIRGSMRPSLPFNENYWITDSHFYSSVLWMYFVLAFHIYHRMVSKWILPVLFITAVASALLTGGRSGLVLMVSYFFIYNILTFRPYIKRRYMPFYFAGLIALIPTIFFFWQKVMESNLIQRALNFDLINDPSSLSRVRKLKLALDNNLDTGLLFGQGFLTQRARWYDGGFATINAYFGLTGALVVLILLYNFFSNRIFSYRKSQPVLFAVLYSFTMSYIITNLISDYFLLTRSIFPFVLNFVLIQYYFNNKRKREIQTL